MPSSVNKRLQKRMERSKFLKVSSGQASFKKENVLSVHVFRPKVNLELCERCSKRFSKVSHSVHTVVQVVIFTGIKAIYPGRAGASLRQARWPVSNGLL